MNRKIPARALPLIALMVLAAACGDDDPAGPGNTSPMPDFAVLDVNPTSATGAQLVSPRDYLQKVSVWYFGRAT